MMDYKELIAKYVTNETSAEENTALLDWVISDETNKREFIEYCQAWQISNASSHTYDSTKAYQKFVESKRHETKTISLWKSYKIAVAAAAVAILTVGLFFVFKQSTPNNITIANNTTINKTIVLSDGSQIVLKKGASITYPEVFETDARNINIEGTAFCAITRNENAPFTISSKSISVNVLGTSFEVSCSPSESHVIVESGTVKVAQNDSKNNSIITKGERIDVTKNGFVSSKNNDINFLSWKTGILYFNKTSLKQVFSDIERHYKCSFTVSNKDIYNKTITGTYQDLTLIDIVTLINSAFPELEFTNITENIIEVKIQ